MKDFVNICVLLTVTVLMSRESESSYVYGDYCNDHGGGNYEWQICLNKRLDVSNKELSSVIQLSKKHIIEHEHLKPYEKAFWFKRLSDSQQSWELYLEKDCVDLMSSEWGGGTGTVGGIEACLIEMTERRIDDLKLRYR